MEKHRDAINFSERWMFCEIRVGSDNGFCCSELSRRIVLSRVVVVGMVGRIGFNCLIVRLSGCGDATKSHKVTRSKSNNLWFTLTSYFYWKFTPTHSDLTPIGLVYSRTEDCLSIFHILHLKSCLSSGSVSPHQIHTRRLGTPKKKEK